LKVYFILLLYDVFSEIIDRLTVHAYLFKITGKSFKIKYFCEKLTCLHTKYVNLTGRN